jgi:subtilase family serine protease
MPRSFCYSLFLVAGVAYGAAAATPAAKYVIANNTPRFLPLAQKLGDADTSQVIDVTLWLTPHNRAALDSLVARQYDRTSAQYHKWLDRDTLRGLIAPSEPETREVADFLRSNGLTVVSTDKFNLFVRARGTVGAMQKAFNTKLANVAFRGQTMRSNLSDPEIDDPAGAHVMAIEGLDESKFTHPNIAQTAAPKGISNSAVALRTAPSAKSGGLSDKCFPGTTSETFTTNGGLPSGTFTGNLYTESLTGCGFTPPDIQAAYGLTALYNQSLDGTGQTIVIVDWCGSPTITGDANAYSAKYGLPPLTSSNFAIINYPGISGCSAPDPEINIDVEWAHAIAPGASIVLLVPASASFTDINASWLYIIENGLGSIVSNSYGAEEIYTPLSILNLQNYILEVAAASGIGFNFSSGDDGDYTFDITGLQPSVSDPADSPYATAIGGISLALSPTNAITWQAAWGTNITLLADDGVFVPALNFGFDFGSGGGNSVLFTKPTYQAALKGAYRHVPDISWLADPYTGGVIAISEPFQSPSLVYQVYGGTSLACPMVSGLLAIANQAAGTSLGLAAPLLYGAPSSVITDIVPVGSSTNVTAFYQTATGTAHESAKALAEPLEKSKVFMSAIWNYPDEPGFAYLLTFGTDSGLPALTGYDFATGLGVINPAALITYVTPSPSIVTGH